MRKPSIKHIVFTIECLDEHIPIKGNCLASGNDLEDKREESRILKELEFNQWAWCTVVVKASIPGIDLEGIDSLGCCSYTSEEEFKNGGYYEDMQHNALQDLKDKIKAIQEVNIADTEGTALDRE